jgi:hypothetical protein
MSGELFAVPKKTNKHPEHDFQEMAFPYLERALPLLPGEQYASVWGIDNATGKMADYVKFARARRGVRGGPGDLYCFWSGGSSWWELKSAHGTLTDGQKLFRRLCGLARIPHFEAKTLPEIEAQIRSLGLVPRMTAEVWMGLHNLHKRKGKDGSRKPRREAPNRAALNALARARAKGVFA